MRSFTNYDTVWKADIQFSFPLSIVAALLLCIHHYNEYPPTCEAVVLISTKSDWIAAVRILPFINHSIPNTECKNFIEVDFPGGFIYSTLVTGLSSPAAGPWLLVFRCWESNCIARSAKCLAHGVQIGKIFHPSTLCPRRHALCPGAVASLIQHSNTIKYSAINFN